MSPFSRRFLLISFVLASLAGSGCGVEASGAVVGDRLVAGGGFVFGRDFGAGGGKAAVAEGAAEEGVGGADGGNNCRKTGAWRANWRSRASS